VVYSEQGFYLMILNGCLLFLEFPKNKSFTLVLSINMTGLVLLLFVRYFDSGILAFMSILLMGSSIYSQEVMIQSLLVEKYHHELHEANTAFRLIQALGALCGIIILITFNDPILPMVIWLGVVAVLAFVDLKKYFAYENEK
jgi:hypothetical protein